MIDYFFGKPRTGKTYRAVDIIYKEYIKEDSSPKFTNILTNIGGFKFKEINEIFLNRGSTSIAYKLIWKKFHEHLSVMQKMALDDKSDDELNRYAYSHKINDCLIVIDEASLYMKKYDDALSWYLAYHGHFKVRIIIIAQGPKQINSEYLIHAEIYYEAQPQSKQLSNKKLRYIHYSEAYLSKDCKFSSDILSSKQEIFDLYKSGEVDKPKKILYKFIFMMVLALFSMIFFFKFLLYRLSPSDSLDSSAVINRVTDNNLYSSVPGVNMQLLVFRCDSFSCSLVSDKYAVKYISLTYLKFVVLKNDLQLSFSDVKNEIYKLVNLDKGQQKVSLAFLTDYYYFVSDDIKNLYFHDMFQKKKINKRIRVPIINNNFDKRRNDERISEE